MFRTIHKAVLFVGVLAASLTTNAEAAKRFLTDEDPLINPLQATVNELATEITDLNATIAATQAKIELLQAQVDRRVSFTAYLSEDVNETRQAVVVFDTIVSNTGHAYDNETGVFTAPYDGDYMFMVTADVSDDYEEIKIQKDKHWVVYGQNDGGDHHVTAWTTMTLKAGEEVQVENAGDVGGTVYGGMGSLFSGFLIH
nr:hypothetical protein BaRGS_000248 [Batillaria attramentaria]